MAARHTGETAIAGIAVGQLPSYGDASAVGLAVLVVVGHVGSVGFARAVQDEALGPLGTVGDPGAVVVAETLAAHCVEAADDLGVHQQAAEGFAVGMGQFEQVGRVCWPVPWSAFDLPWVPPLSGPCSIRSMQ